MLVPSLALERGERGVTVWCAVRLPRRRRDVISNCFLHFLAGRFGQARFWSRARTANQKEQRRREGRRRGWTETARPSARPLSQSMSRQCSGNAQPVDCLFASLLCSAIVRLSLFPNGLSLFPSFLARCFFVRPPICSSSYLFPSPRLSCSLLLHRLAVEQPGVATTPFSVAFGFLHSLLVDGLLCAVWSALYTASTKLIHPKAPRGQGLACPAPQGTGPMRSSSVLSLLWFAAVLVASPVSQFAGLSGLSGRSPDPATTILLHIAPTSGSCASAAVPGECRTAAQAAPFLVAAFAAHGLFAPAQLAAVLALQAFESADFKYARNHFPAPGRPGQGTRNMQRASFNLAYALAAPDLAAAAAALAPARAVDDSLDPAALDAILALVLPDVHAFATGPWFLATQCTPAVRDALVNNPDAGFAEYIACVGADLSDDRLAYWARAKLAFGLP